MKTRRYIDICYSHIPKLIASVHCENFIQNLDQALKDLVSFDQSCIFFYPASARPFLLHDNLQDAPEKDAMQNYINGTYLFDPVYTACTKGYVAGLYRMVELAPDDFFKGEYFNSPYVHPCISMNSGALAEEIVFLSPLSAGGYSAYSLMRCNSSRTFSAAEIDRLRWFQPVLEALCQQHYAQLSKFSENEIRLHSIADQLELAISGFAADFLTKREQSIVRLILRGHSSLSISLNLGITEGTVKNHRKNIYCKLDVSSQSELFHMFVSHLLGANLVKIPIR